jgi:hypothetical protein
MTGRRSRCRIRTPPGSLRRGRCGWSTLLPMTAVLTRVALLGNEGRAEPQLADDALPGRELGATRRCRPVGGLTITSIVRRWHPVTFACTWPFLWCRTGLFVSCRGRCELANTFGCRFGLLGEESDAVSDQEPDQRVGPDCGCPFPPQWGHEHPIDGDEGGEDLGAADGDLQDAGGPDRPKGAAGSGQEDGSRKAPRPRARTHRPGSLSSRQSSCWRRCRLHGW